MTVEDLAIADNPDERRYELRVDGEIVGFVEYRSQRGSLVLTHTWIDRERRQRGLATALIKGVFEDAAERAASVVPRCPFVVDYVVRHPESLEQVDERHQRRFR